MKLRLRLAAGLSASLIAFFILPYLINDSTGISESSMYGYSNRAALLVFILCTVAIVVWQKGFGLAFPARSCDESNRLRHRLLWITALASAILATAVWFAARPGISFQEAPYFLDRYAMAEMGQRLYRDIDFSYGPLMFYAPIALARIAHISVVDAFFVAWIAQWFAAIAVLWKVVDLIVEETGFRHGRTLYLLLWAFCTMDVLASAPNYTPLRYASGLLLALCSWRLFKERPSAFPAALCAACGSVLLLLYSPEQGLALAVASIVFFALNALRGRGFLPAALAFLAILGAGLSYAARIGELATLGAVSSGALHVPIFLSAQNLAFLILLAVTASASWTAIRTRRTNHPLLYVALVATASLPAAFGPANPGHMFYNLLGAIIVALIVLGNKADTWQAARTAFILLFLIGGAVEHAFMDHAAITIPARRWIVATGNRDSALRRLYIATMTRALGPDEMRGRLVMMDNDAKPIPPQSELHGFAPGTMVMAPFGIARPAHEQIGGLHIFTGRYPWLLPLLNSHQIADKISELQAHPTLPLLIPDVSDGSACRYDLQALRQRTEQNSLPFYIPQVRHEMKAADPLCAYIVANYRPAHPPETGKPSIWFPIDRRRTLGP